MLDVESPSWAICTNRFTGFTALHLICVFDYDFGLQDDFMGSAFLDLAQLELNRPTDVTLTLKDPHYPDHDLGIILLSVILTPKEGESRDVRKREKQVAQLGLRKVTMIKSVPEPASGCVFEFFLALFLAEFNPQLSSLENLLTGSRDSSTTPPKQKTLKVFEEENYCIPDQVMHILNLQHQKEPLEIMRLNVVVLVNKGIPNVPFF
ncbi:hypothetical protein P7K49_005001 [Saguinus oedipus]|uniref:Uncharacterized protein n=1 Tax=Saguinus oedipus TaxID=9490 RepID=A0ABQ9W907_SAGOE|nr:hypothetical protein P7K49_005001 [Saguinus oedipus]